MHDLTISNDVQGHYDVRENLGGQNRGSEIYSKTYKNSANSNLSVVITSTNIFPNYLNKCAWLLHAFKFICFVVLFSVFGDETIAVKEERRVSILYKLFFFNFVFAFC